MTTNLAIIQIILPLIGGLIAFITPKNLSWLFSCLIMLFTFFISCFIFKETLSSEPIFYHFGGWWASIGIEYKIDQLSSFFILLTSTLSLFNLFAMKHLVASELDKERYSLFFGLYLIAIAGLLGICVSNDIFNIYVLLEVSSITSYALVASPRTVKSSKAGFDYLIFGTIGSTFILLGIGFIYALTGSLNLSIISQKITPLLDNNACIAGIMLIIVGVLMKAALFPLSKWLANIYQDSPPFIAAMLSSVSNKIGIYLLIRFFFNVFALHKHNYAYLDIILLLLAIMAIFICSILALKQTNIKTFLAYSSLSQIGFIILSIAIASDLSLSGALIYCLSHALEKSALFLAAGCFILLANKEEDLSSFSGFIKQHSWISLLFIINLLSSVGFPFTAGFVGKWQILKAALATDLWYILMMLIAVLFTFSYVLRFIELLIFEKEHVKYLDQEIISDRYGNSTIYVVAVLTILNLYIGINHDLLINQTNNIAALILK
jgi:multicomponent Na+:H+ antiporter subunit D